MVVHFAYGRIPEGTGMKPFSELKATSIVEACMRLTIAESKHDVLMEL